MLTQLKLRAAELLYCGVTDSEPFKAPCACNFLAPRAVQHRAERSIFRMMIITQFETVSCASSLLRSSLRFTPCRLDWSSRSPHSYSRAQPAFATIPFPTE